MDTVRNEKEARKVVAAGAMFIVRSNTDPEVVRYAAAHQVPVVTGGFTQTEVYASWAAAFSANKP